ncbi:MAG TPA: GntR family transcriptional regulator [Firmicutes bacterium]|nr:GntR family transcriptional regulator [Bacillota bacterium]
MKEPMYKQIENYVLELIKSNQIKEGEFIPTEKQLSEEFNVARMTVRTALNNLANEGYISRQRGIGSKVVSQHITDNIGKLSGFTDEMQKNGYVVSNLVMNLKIVEADEELSQQLSVEEGENIWKIERVRLANNKRVSYMLTYMPVKLFPNLRRSDCDGSLYAYIKNQCGHKIMDSERSVRALISDPELEELLELESTEPILYICQVSKLENGDVFEYSHTYHAGYTLTLNAKAE